MSDPINPPDEIQRDAKGFRVPSISRKGRAIKQPEQTSMRWVPIPPAPSSPPPTTAPPSSPFGGSRSSSQKSVTASCGTGSLEFKDSDGERLGYIHWVNGLVQEDGDQIIIIPTSYGSSPT